MSPETVLRQLFIKEMHPEIGVEPVESGAVNPGFPDLLLSVPGKDGLFPVELKVGKISNGTLTVKYRADQNAKQYELRRRTRHVYTVMYVPETGVYYVVRDYRERWKLNDLKECAVHCGTSLRGWKEELLK